MKINRTVIVVVVLLAAVAVLLSRVLDRSAAPPIKKPSGTVPADKTPQATMEPGRVLILNTTAGKMEFVLFERDCPRSTSALIRLVEDGNYSWVGIQLSNEMQANTAPVPGGDELPALETLEGLANAKGTIGLLPDQSDHSSASGSLYILKDPMPIMDGDYTVLGRLINGMDVLYKLSTKDKIVTASVRELLAADKDAYAEALDIEARRLVDE